MLNFASKSSRELATNAETFARSDASLGIFRRNMLLAVGGFFTSIMMVLFFLSLLFPDMSYRANPWPLLAASFLFLGLVLKVRRSRTLHSGVGRLSTILLCAIFGFAVYVNGTYAMVFMPFLIAWNFLFLPQPSNIYLSLAIIAISLLPIITGKEIDYALWSRELVMGIVSILLFAFVSRYTSRLLSRLIEKERRLVRQNSENSRLRQDAEAANTAKSAFLATMSHEIRTPLNAIIGMTHLLADSKLNGDQQEEIDAIRVSSNNLLSLVNNILDFSKIEAGEFMLEPHLFSPFVLLEELRVMYNRLAQDKGLILDINPLEPTLPPVLEGDANRLRQMLINFLNNALKFTEKGRIELNVSEVRRDDDARKVVLRFGVTDTGIGITEEVQERIFLPFQQADASTARFFGGTGLGLSIVREFAEMMSGRVGVDSVLGEGSTFWFEVPLRIASPPEITDEALAGTERLKCLRVLVVDDSRMNLDVCKRILRKDGAIVTLCESGAEALAKLTASPTGFDIVLMDIQMPTMSGLKTAQVIRHQPQLQDLPIIALTAGATQEDRIRALQVGMIDFLTKPIDPVGLIRNLQRYVKKNQRQAPTLKTSATITPNHTPTLSRWPDIAGINSKMAKELMDDDVEFFAEMLTFLVTEHTATGHRVREMFESGESFETIAWTVHRIRGQAANTAATRLATAAGQLENALKANAANIASLIPPFETAHRELLYEVKNWLAKR